jgi:hypothetical protein
VPTHVTPVLHVGHGDEEELSQVSPRSSFPFPHVGAETGQSLSFALLQPAGQHPSAFTHAVCVPETAHFAVHVPWFCNVKSWHPCCGQAVGQFASHVSPGGSVTPFPQTAGQSLSFVLLQPFAQQPSPLMH